MEPVHHSAGACFVPGLFISQAILCEVCADSDGPRRWLHMLLFMGRVLDLAFIDFAHAYLTHEADRYTDVVGFSGCAQFQHGAKTVTGQVSVGTGQPHPLQDGVSGLGECLPEGANP